LELETKRRCSRRAAERAGRRSVAAIVELIYLLCSSIELVEFSLL
jgi:hypothetical protein